MTLVFMAVMMGLSDIHYYHCQRIMQLLEQAEQGRVKNIFGQVFNQIIKPLSEGKPRWMILINELLCVVVINSTPIHCFVAGMLCYVPMRKTMCTWGRQDASSFRIPLI